MSPAVLMFSIFLHMFTEIVVDVAWAQPGSAEREMRNRLSHFVVLFRHYILARVWRAQQIRFENTYLILMLFLYGKIEIAICVAERKIFFQKLPTADLWIYAPDHEHHDYDSYIIIFWTLLLSSLLSFGETILNNKPYWTCLKSKVRSGDQTHHWAGPDRGQLQYSRRMLSFHSAHCLVYVHRAWKFPSSVQTFRANSGKIRVAASVIHFKSLSHIY